MPGCGSSTRSSRSGVKPQRVAIGHTCCLDDPTADIIKQIAKRGAFVGFDRVTGGAVPDDKKVRMMLAFLEAGYADHLLLSSDYNFTARSAARPGYGTHADGLRAEAAPGGREGRDDPPHHRRQPAPVSRIRAERRLRNPDESSPSVCGRGVWTRRRRPRRSGAGPRRRLESAAGRQVPRRSAARLVRVAAGAIEGRSLRVLPHWNAGTCSLVQRCGGS